MTISKYLIPPVAGLLCDSVPYALSKVLPRQEDNFPLARVRAELGNFCRHKIALSDNKRFYCVILPDNIGFAGATVAAWFLYNSAPLTMEFSPYLMSGIFLTIAAFSQMRHLLYMFAVPLSKKIPLIGDKLSQFFLALSPSDLRNCNSLFEKIAHKIQNSEFIKATIAYWNKTGAGFAVPIPVSHNY